VSYESCLQERENFHNRPPQGRQQVPDGLLQPPQEQHGRAEATEEAEGEEGNAVKTKMPSYFVSLICEPAMCCDNVVSGDASNFS